MTRPYVINILMLEDNPQYLGSFEGAASKERIVVKAVNNAEDLISMLREKPRFYKFIVLDAKAFFSEDDSGSPSEVNLHYIFRELKNIENEHGVVFKYAINTGFADIKITHERVVDCQIFNKGKENDLFDYIWQEHDKKEEAFVKKQYPEVIPLYDSYFTDKVQENLISLYFNHAYNNPSLGSRLDNLTSLRMINEQIMDILLKELHGKTSDEITGSRGSRSKAIAEYLISYRIISDSLKDQCVSIYYTCSKYGGHSEEDVRDDPDFPSNRMISAHAMGLLELIKTTNKLLHI